MQKRNIKWYKRLTTRFLVMALVLFMLPQTFIFFYATNNASQMLEESLRNDLMEKSFLVGKDIDRYFDQRLHDVKLISQADVLESNDTAAIIQYLTEITSDTPYLDDIDVIDISGLVIASSGVQNEAGQHVLSLYPSLKEIFGASLSAAQGDIFVSQVVDLDSGNGLAFLTPITDDSNTRVIKVMLVEVNLDIVKQMVAEFDARVIGDKYVYLVDNDGRVIVTADPAVELHAHFPDLFVKPELLENFSLQGDVGSVVYTDATGVEVMAGFADMAELGVNVAMDWSIIAVAPIDAITEPVSAFRRSFLIITLIILSIVAIAMLWTSRSIVRSVGTLMTGAVKVGKGDIHFRVNATADDEFGFLAQAINNTLDSLVTSQQEAQASTATKSRFLATMSHEIRTPMAGVVGIVDLILKRDLDPELRAWVQDIKNSSLRLMKILNEILDQSKLDAGKITLDPVDFHLKDLVEEVARLYTPEMSSRGLGFNLEIDEQLPDAIHGDSLRIGQILGNLLSNAAKFTAKGEITLVVEQHTRGDDNLVLRFTVLDNGIGIEPAALAELFQPFAQADSSTTREFGGTGLGLSISRQLATLMGGQIDATSVPRVGSRFWFTLPYRNAAENFERKNNLAPTANWTASRPLKILLAEDTHALQLVVSTLMSDLGHEVTLVTDGKVAAEQAVAHPFDIILMDLRMPVMDGFEATRLIRSQAGTSSEVPIIALTADLANETASMCVDAGMNGICGKPIDLADLLLSIDTALGDPVHTRRSEAIDADTAEEDPVGEGPAENLVVLDTKTHEKLAETLGEVTMQEILEIGHRELSNLTRKLKDACSSSDLANITVIMLHNIKSISATLGAHRLSSVAGEAERTCRDGTISAVDAQNVITCSEDAVEALNTLRRRPQSVRAANA